MTTSYIVTFVDASGATQWGKVFSKKAAALKWGKWLARTAEVQSVRITQGQGGILVADIKIGT